MSDFHYGSNPGCAFNQSFGASAYLGHKGANQGAHFTDCNAKPNPQGPGLRRKNLMGESRKHIYGPVTRKPRFDGVYLRCVDIADLERCRNESSADEDQACDRCAVSTPEKKHSRTSAADECEDLFKAECNTYLPRQVNKGNKNRENIKKASTMLFFRPMRSSTKRSSIGPGNRT